MIIGVTFVAQASDLHCSHAGLTRGFKQTYGLSPLQLRNLLRVFEAHRLLLMEMHTVGDAAMGVRFNDAGKFNQQFRRIMKAPPAAFKSDGPKRLNRFR